jgi:DNA-binding response OmpR family regulator
VKNETKSTTLIHGSLKMLIAEDEPELLKTYKILFEHEGYRVIATDDGQECIDAYRAELEKTQDNSPPFDMVLLDYRMPAKNGDQVASEILALCPTQKLLMVTAYSGLLGTNNETLKKIQVMPKPFDFDHLFATIASELKNVYVYLI